MWVGVTLLFADLMKKMKKIVPLESPPYADYEDQRTRHRHQSLLQDHEELLKVVICFLQFLTIHNFLLWVSIDLMFFSNSFVEFGCFVLRSLLLKY